MSAGGSNSMQRYLERDFANDAELADALAADVAERLRVAIAERGNALDRKSVV